MNHDEGFYYTDQAGRGAAANPNAYGPYPPGDMPEWMVLVLLLGLLALLIGLLLLWMQDNRREPPEDVIHKALNDAGTVALNAYGPATVSAAVVFAGVVRKYLGPVLDLASPVSAALKKIDEAAKGKTKDPPKSGDGKAGHPGGASRIVVMGDYHGPSPDKPGHEDKPAERDMTPEEQISEARKAIEAMVAAVRAPDFKSRLKAARNALNKPPREKPVVVATTGGSGGHSVGPKPKHS